jgi:hypothetical protein
VRPEILKNYIEEMEKEYKCVSLKIRREGRTRHR